MVPCSAYYQLAGTPAVSLSGKEGSLLDYCNGLYMGLAIKMVQNNQQVQNAAVIMLTGVIIIDHVIPSLQELYWF